MVIHTNEIQSGVFYLVSNMKIVEIAERDFLDWADDNACYTPTASEMEQDDEGRWPVRVMKEPV
jgi:hypothetical protein